jgi:hypothetical protein
MAGSASNWFRPTAGPLAGQAVYIDKANRTDFSGQGMPVPRHVLQSALNRSPDILQGKIKASKRPAGTAQTGGQFKARQARRAKFDIADPSTYPKVPDPQTVSNIKNVKKPKSKQEQVTVTLPNGGQTTFKATVHGPYYISKAGHGGYQVSSGRTQWGSSFFQTKKEAVSYTTYMQASDLKDPTDFQDPLTPFVHFEALLYAKGQ